MEVFIVILICVVIGVLSSIMKMDKPPKKPKKTEKEIIEDECIKLRQEKNEEEWERYLQKSEAIREQAFKKEAERVFGKIKDEIRELNLSHIPGDFDTIQTQKKMYDSIANIIPLIEPALPGAVKVSFELDVPYQISILVLQILIADFITKHFEFLEEEAIFECISIKNVGYIEDNQREKTDGISREELLTARDSLIFYSYFVKGKQYDNTKRYIDRINKVIDGEQISDEGLHEMNNQ